MNTDGLSIEELNTSPSKPGELDTFQEVDNVTKELLAAKEDAGNFIEEMKTHTNDMTSISKLNDIKENMIRGTITPEDAKTQASKFAMF